MITKGAIDHLCKALREDPDYRLGWECNIAMAFKDQFHFSGEEHDRELVHRIANRAAAAFIDQLIGKDVGELDGMAAVAYLHQQADPMVK